MCLFIQLSIFTDPLISPLYRCLSHATLKHIYQQHHHLPIAWSDIKSILQTESIPFWALIWPMIILC